MDTPAIMTGHSCHLELLLHHYAGFSQIGSHISYNTGICTVCLRASVDISGNTLVPVLHYNYILHVATFANRVTYVTLAAL